MSAARTTWGGGATKVESAASDEAVGDAVKHLDDVPKDRSVDLAVGDRSLGAGGLAPDLVDGAAACPGGKGGSVNGPGPRVDFGLARARRHAVQGGEGRKGPQPVLGSGDGGG